MQSFLLLDGSLVENSWLLRRKLIHPALRREEPVLASGHLYGSILKDPKSGLLRAYYTPDAINVPNEERRPQSIHLAESLDGVHWTEPKLGLVEIEGCRENNVVLGPNQLDPSGKILTRATGLNCISILDAEAEPHPCARSRYTALYLGSGEDERGLCLAHSDDGLTWHAYSENPVITQMSDTFNQLIYDRRIGKYVVYARPHFVGGPITVPRAVVRMESENLLEWSMPKVVLDTDEADGDGCQYVPSPALPPGRNPKAKSDCRGRNRQFYSLHVHQTGDLYIGIAWVYEIMLGTQWPELLHSKDGIHWNREPLRKPYLSPRGPGFPDAARIGSPYLPFPVEMGDEHWFYVTASNYTHHKVIFGEGPMQDVVMLYSTPKDRWVGYEAEQREGTLLTAPIQREDFKEVAFNGAIKPGGSLRVEVCYEREGAPVPGLKPFLLEPDGTGLDTVRHTCGPLLSGLPADVHRFRLRWWLKNAELYAFYLS